VSDFAVPERVATDIAFTAMTTGVDHSCGLTAGGAAYCWGGGHFGQLGNGAVEMNDPLPTPAHPGIGFGALSVGNSFTCGLGPSGDAYCWGLNSWGQLGDGSNSNSAAAVRVGGVPGFAALSAGSYHACGATDEGTVHCWGQNEYGQLGGGTFAYETVPVPVAGFTAAPSHE
jgi:alpha-tubulin suppressor-like RCC1 family protein